MAPPATKPFLCELCRKSYARISDLEQHESSYDHHHRKRAADLRSANKDPGRREREQAKDGVLRHISEEEVSRNNKNRPKRGFKSAFDQIKPEQESQGVDEKRPEPVPMEAHRKVSNSKPVSSGSTEPLQQTTTTASGSEGLQPGTAKKMKFSFSKTPDKVANEEQA